MKLGLALAGGGMRGIAHAGFLKALEENNINIDMVRRNKFWEPYCFFNEYTGINRMIYMNCLNKSLII